MARSSSVTGGAIVRVLRLAHEPLARGADERHRLGEEQPHCVAERNRLLVDRALRLQLGERGGGQLDGSVQRQRRELLALRLLHGLRLLLRELAQPAHQIVGVAPERESEASTFHGLSVAAALGSSERTLVAPLDLGSELLDRGDGLLERGGKGRCGVVAERLLEPARLESEPGQEYYRL